MKEKNKKMSRKKDGYALIYLIVIVFIFSAMMFPLMSRLATELKVTTTGINKEKALAIAEAGINYYKWHLIHFPTDYQDGTASPGPYIHDYLDQENQKIIGQFSLEIIPPETGKSITTIKSTGTTVDNPNLKRLVSIKFDTNSRRQTDWLSN